MALLLPWSSVWKRSIWSEQSLAAAMGLFISKCGFRVKTFGFSPAQGSFLLLHACRGSWVQSMVGRAMSVICRAHYAVSAPGLMPCCVRRHSAVVWVVEKLARYWHGIKSGTLCQAAPFLFVCLILILTLS